MCGAVKRKGFSIATEKKTKAHSILETLPA
jgi:hypothetical protein